MMLGSLFWAALALAVLYTQAYTMLTRFISIVLHTYFRKIELYGLNNLPREGPVILCPNHPNMLVDPLIVITECAKHGRNSYVWVKGAMFANPVGAFVLDKLGCVPVYRPPKGSGSLEDQDSTLSKDEINAANLRMFERTWQTLAAGELMLLFPEGTSYTAPKMLSLRTGVVRVAAGFVQHHNQPIPIVPVGLTYFNKEHFRSQVMLEFGAPLVITPDDVQSEPFQRDDHAEVKRLTQLLERKMHAITLNAREVGTLRVARVMRRLFLNTSGLIAANQEVRLTQHIVTLLEREDLAVDKKARVDAVRDKVKQYQDALERLRIKDQDLLLPVQKHSVLQLFLERAVYLLVLLPLATPGLLINFPYYFIGHKLNSLAGYVESKSMFKIFAAAVLVPVHWLLMIFATWHWLGASYAYVLAVGLPVLLYSYIRVLEESRSFVENVYFLVSIATHADKVAALRQTRAALAQEVYDIVSGDVDPEFLSTVRRSLTNSPPRANALLRRNVSTSDTFRMR
ncbi:hypothetical protein PybrP1_005451 [[Pythium] brassicae (nom. inval.)]|nr:hypothetical protein PybrP1_005451 [[Pythium] brassicae (nom. inval.)]